MNFLGLYDRVVEYGLAFDEQGTPNGPSLQTNSISVSSDADDEALMAEERLSSAITDANAQTDAVAGASELLHPLKSEFSVFQV